MPEPENNSTNAMSNAIHERGPTRKNAAHLGRRILCDCGREATLKKCSAWICPSCWSLEARYYGTNRDGNKMSRMRHELP